MENVKNLKIAMEDLCIAMDDASYEHQYYLDLQTGELIFFSEYATDSQELEQSREQMGEYPERYEAVPRADSGESYRDMEDFIDTLTDTRPRELLDAAIGGRGAFRRFKDVLAGFPEEREKWFKFKEDRLRGRATEWLEDIGVKPA